MKKTIPCPECCGKGFISCYADNSMWATNCNNCNGTGSLEVTMNNFDRIKAMSVEEMADFLLEVHSNGWVMGANDDLEDPLYNKEWLESEVQGE